MIRRYISRFGDDWTGYQYVCSSCGCETNKSFSDRIPSGWTTPLVGRMLEHRCPACPYIKPVPPPPPPVVRHFYPNANQEGAE